MNPKRRIGNILLIIGAALLIAGGFWYLCNKAESERASVLSDELTGKVKTVIEGSSESGVEAGGSSSSDTAGEGMPSELTVVDVDGYPCIGYLTIPSADLEMAVLDNWEDQNLKHSLCRYFGSPYTNDFIIAGHNYSSWFGKLKELEIGDEVIFTDMNGNVYVYAVEEMEVIPGTGTEEMISAEWDLTLFTCTYGGWDRYTVRCKYK